MTATMPSSTRGRRRQAREKRCGATCAPRPYVWSICWRAGSPHGADVADGEAGSRARAGHFGALPFHGVMFTPLSLKFTGGGGGGGGAAGPRPPPPPPRRPPPSAGAAPPAAPPPAAGGPPAAAPAAGCRGCARRRGSRVTTAAATATAAAAPAAARWRRRRRWRDDDAGEHPRIRVRARHPSRTP